MFRLSRNERSHWSGNGVHVEPESVFMIGRNMHLQQMGAFQGKKCLNFVLIKWIGFVHLKFAFFNAIHWTGMNNTIADSSGKHLSQYIQILVNGISFIFFVAKFHYEQFNVTRTI